MDTTWPLPFETDAATMLATLPPAARAMMQGDGTLTYVRSGQANVLVGNTFVFKLAHDGSENVVSLQQEAGLFDLFAEHDLAGAIDADLPVMCQTITADGHGVVGIIRSKVHGQDPATLPAGQYPGHDALGQAAARLQVGLRDLGDTARHDPRLSHLPQQRPRTEIDKLNYYGATLVAEDAAIATQLDWARGVLADRAERTQGEPNILCEADLHLRNMLHDGERQRTGFMDFGRCMWVSTPEVAFTKLAIQPQVCKAATDEYEGRTGTSIDRDLVVALAIGDTLAHWGYETPNPRDDVMNDIRSRMGWLADTQQLFNSDSTGDAPTPPRSGTAPDLEY